MDISLTLLPDFVLLEVCPNSFFLSWQPNTYRLKFIVGCSRVFSACIRSTMLYGCVGLKQLLACSTSVANTMLWFVWFVTLIIKRRSPLQKLEIVEIFNRVATHRNKNKTRTFPWSKANFTGLKHGNLYKEHNMLQIFFSFFVQTFNKKI